MGSSGILGMNARNEKYIRVYNRRRKVADDKLQSKDVLRAAGVRVPKLYGSVSTIREFEDFNWKKLPTNFVVKPNRGFGGEGILVLRNALNKQEFLDLPLEARVWLKPDGSEITYDQLRSHVLGILDGQFSLQETPDVAFFERRVIRHKAFREYAPFGIPDVRIIVFNRVPVMAMMRIPTQRSGGRANLAQGAIGVGIDIGRGLTTTASIKLPWRRVIDTHPETGVELHGFAIPFWDDILRMAVVAQEASGVGFLGVDVVIDQQEGPVMLELNARPGLEIQVVNQDGLERRLERVEGLKIQTAEKGIRVAKDLFGGETEKLVEEVSGREMIGTVEVVRVANPANLDHEESVLAKIDTGAFSTSISKDVARKLGFDEVLNEFQWMTLDPNTPPKESSALADEVTRKLKGKIPGLVKAISIRSGSGLGIRPVVRVVVEISGKKVSALANITERSGLKYEMIVGRSQLRRFLIDPARAIPKRDPSVVGKGVKKRPFLTIKRK
ncbi:MAG: ATP-dependent zinc protease [Candidatus Doudnabacteria bacterium]|nr:ATP-dependent zinc protease [Candidatus Doudnabacteria bacterium]